MPGSGESEEPRLGGGAPVVSTAFARHSNATGGAAGAWDRHAHNGAMSSMVEQGFVLYLMMGAILLVFGGVPAALMCRERELAGQYEQAA